MCALQAEGIEQADDVLGQVAQGVGRSTRLVADRSAGVAVVIEDAPPMMRRMGGSTLSPNVWVQRSTPFARMILSLASIG
jgi:hypothetical protein